MVNLQIYIYIYIYIFFFFPCCLSSIIVCMSLCIDFQDTGCVEFSVRLAYRGSTNSTGQIEVCSSNMWQPVCSGFVDQAVSHVICRELGFTAYDETGARPEVFNAVPLGMDLCNREIIPLCSGSESSLGQCFPFSGRNRRLIAGSLVTSLRCLGMLCE